MRFRKVLALVLFVVITLSLSFSGGNVANAISSSNVTHNLGSEPPRMNSILSTDTASGDVLRHIMEGLVKYDKQNRPVAGIAKSWDISKDGLKYTFHLRDAKWANGTPVTAKDFDFAWKQVANKDNASEYANLMYLIKGGQAYNEGKGKVEDVGIKVIDDKTLEVTLEKPTAYFLSLLTYKTFLPVNEEFYKKHVSGGKVTYATEADKILCNGPWVMKSWAHNDKIVLTKNPTYYNASDVKIDQITMLMVLDTNTAYNMFAAGECDIVGLKGIDQVERAQRDGFKPLSFFDGGTFYFQYNLKDPVTKNVNIRKALTYAIDRVTLIKSVFKNASIPALSFTNPVINGEKGTFQSEVGNILKDNNKKEAKALLAQGLKELGLKKMPKLTMLADDTDVAKRDAAAFQQFWRINLGIKVEIQNMPFKSRLARMTEKDFQIVLAGWGPDYNDPMTFLDLMETTNGNNNTSYSDKEYDGLLEKARNEVDTHKRFEILKQTEKKLMEDLPIGPIYFRSTDYVVNPKLDGVVRTSFQRINLYWASVK